MNVPVVADMSFWINKDPECKLGGGIVSPLFVPKVNSITMEYDSVLGSSFGMSESSLFHFLMSCQFLIHFFYSLS
jgi:hypothetical protein